MQNPFSGSAKTTDTGIKKHFKNYEYEKALFELIWNGLDAGANSVEMSLNRNSLDGIETIEIKDDGNGIDFLNIEDNFGKFNDSLKRNDSDKHGSHGRGRFAFHKLCNKAIWYTKFNNDNVKITIESSSLKNFEGSPLKEFEQHSYLRSIPTGTCVVLSNFDKQNLENIEELKKLFSIEFGWFLALNKSRNIIINGENIEIPEHELSEPEFEIENHKFNIKVFRWIKKPSSEKSYNYLVNNDNKVLQRKLSSFNQKNNFYTTTYIFSDLNDEFNQEGLEISPEHNKHLKIYDELSKKLLSYQKKIYQDFLRSYVDQRIQSFDDDGYFPDYKYVDPNFAHWRKQNTKSIIKEIYISDPSIFNTLNIKQSKILIRLLDRILISNENDAVLEVIDSVLDLDEKKTKKFAEHLKRTTLDNVISTIEILQKRQNSIHKLREIMLTHYKEVLETPDLQGIIEANTWLFGPQYTILGAEEDTFQSTAKRLRDTIKDIHVINDDDIANGSNVEGVNRQVDLFLARKQPSYDSKGNQIFKCIIIEIKRPGISLNKKHLRQLEDYADIISKHAGFSSELMKFELILIGRKISKDDTYINRQLEGQQEKGESGLVSIDSKIKCYVKTWFSIFDEFELSNQHLLSTLNTKLDNLSGFASKKIVTELQK